MLHAKLSNCFVGFAVGLVVFNLNKTNSVTQL